VDTQSLVEREGHTHCTSENVSAESKATDVPCAGIL
jgi:hypothetical protein